MCGKCFMPLKYTPVSMAGNTYRRVNCGRCGLREILCPRCGEFIKIFPHHNDNLTFKCECGFSRYFIRLADGKYA